MLREMVSPIMLVGAVGRVKINHLQVLHQDIIMVAAVKIYLVPVEISWRLVMVHVLSEAN